jgi:16S rRNA (cytosine1402-N4)-methyltransferase
MTVHRPVMVEEVVEWLQPRPGQVFVDGTLGGGGHARVLATRVGPIGLVIGVDRDAAAVAAAADELSGLPVKLAHANYSDIPEVLEELGIARVDGILIDLGLSSDQLADSQRGFSFHSDGPLDLRFDTSRGEPTWKMVSRMSEQHLATAIRQFGEERYARRIARAIVAQRHHQPIRTARQLAEIIRRATPRRPHERIDPATRTFQALRIAANEELKWLEVALRRLPEVLATGGRLAVISFHSLEDRLVKEAMRCGGLRPTPKPIRPSAAEVQENPRSRSARLRVAERIA